MSEEDDRTESEEQREESEEERREEERMRRADDETDVEKVERSERRHKTDEETDKKELDTEAEDEPIIPEVPQIATDSRDNIFGSQMDEEVKDETQTTEVPQLEVDSSPYTSPTSLDDEVIDRDTERAGTPQVSTSNTGQKRPKDLKTEVSELDKSSPDIPEVETDQRTVYQSGQLEGEAQLQRNLPKDESAADTPTETPEESEEEVEVDKERDVQQSDSSAAATEGLVGGSIGDLPLHDPFELLFEGGGSISSDEPTVIWLDQGDERALKTLETLCMRVYREKSEEKKPSPRIIDNFDELKKEMSRSWTDAAESKITTVKLGEEWHELDEEDIEEVRNRIRTRIQELYSQEFGYLIFDTSEEEALGKSIDLGTHPINQVRIEPRNLSPEQKELLRNLCWGYVDLSRPSDYERIDEFFNNEGQSEYERKMREVEQKIREADDNPFWWHTVGREGNESEEHVRMKSIVVEYLFGLLEEADEVDIQGEIKAPDVEDYVDVEHPFGEEGPRADVYCDRSQELPNVAVEVETLFSKDTDGNRPGQELRDTFKKYDEVTEVDEVWIVMENITLLRHLDDISSISRQYENWVKEGNGEKTVRFYGVDVEERRLVPVQDVVDELTQL